MSAYLYRRLAADCLQRASCVADQGARSALRRMAIASADLADQAEHNSRNDVPEEPAARKTNPEPP
jgi:hypothetical protein